ncbi:chemotaxis protein CheX [Deltaproteobacteria bacterium TL4]
MVEEASNIMSKVLVHEVDREQMQQLKIFFTTHNLVGLKAERYSNIMETLDTNIDLGAVFLCESANSEGKSGLEIAIEIHKVRPELPIIVRIEGEEEDLSLEAKHACAGYYHAGDTHKIKELIEKYIFNTYYPSAMIHGVEEISLEVMKSLFLNSSITIEAPYLVKDRIIHGELFSLIPLEGAWCRGFMMLQTEVDPLEMLIREKKTPLDPTDMDFRTINGLMGELTNMMWGGFKSRFFQDGTGAKDYRIQVPTIINHKRNYITFGTDDPQLCFHCKIHDNDGKLEPVSIYQKFIFHLNWSPDEFKEPPETVDDLVASGELEFF